MTALIVKPLAGGFFAENSKNGSKNCEYQSVTQDPRRDHLKIVTWHGLYIPVETAFIAVDKHSFLLLFRGYGVDETYANSQLPVARLMPRSNPTPLASCP